MTNKELCVNTGSKEFKDLISKYEVSTEDLEIAIKQWIDKGNEWNEETDLELNDYLDLYFKVVSSNGYSSKKLFEKAHALWEKLNHNFTTDNIERAKEVYDKYIKGFGEENVVLFKNNKGSYTVRIAEPYYITTDLTLTDIKKDIEDKVESIVLNESKLTDSDNTIRELSRLYKTRKAIVLNSKLSQSFENYVSKAVKNRKDDKYGFPKAFALTKDKDGYILVKSNNRKNSRLYNVVDNKTGEIIFEKVPVYTKDEELNRIDKLKNEIVTKTYSPAKSASFSLYKEMPNKETFRSLAKIYMHDAFEKAFDKEEAVINYKIIDDYIDSLPDSLFEYVSTSIESEKDPNTNARIDIKNKLDFDIPKLGLIKIAEEITGIKLLGREFKWKYESKYHKYNEVGTLSNKMTRNEITLIIKKILKQEGYFKKSTEEENIRKYAEHNGMTVEEVKKQIQDNLDFDDMTGSAIAHSILDYDWQSVEFENKVIQNFHNEIFEYLNKRYKGKVTSSGLSYLDLFFSGKFNWLNINFNRDSGNYSSDLEYSEYLGEEKINEYKQEESFLRLAAVMHEPFHALHALIYNTEPELKLRESFNNLIKTNFGKELLKLAGDTLGKSKNIDTLYKEICAYTFQLINTPSSVLKESMPDTLLSKKIYNLINKVSSIDSVIVKSEEFKKEEGVQIDEEKIALNFFQKAYNALIYAINKLIPISKKFFKPIENIVKKENDIEVSSIAETIYESPKSKELLKAKNDFLDAFEEFATTLNDLKNIDSSYLNPLNISNFFSKNSKVFEQNNSRINWARTAENSYEVSSKGDKRFSALNAKFKKSTVIEGVDVSGKTIEDVYQTIIKKSGKGQAPSIDSKLYKPYDYKNSIPFIKQLSLLGRFAVPSSNLEQIKKADSKRKDINKITKTSKSYTIFKNLLDFGKFADVDINQLEVSETTKNRIKEIQKRFKNTAAYNPANTVNISEEEAKIRALEYRDMYYIYTPLIQDIAKEIWNIELSTSPITFSAFDLTSSGESELLKSKEDIEDFSYYVGYLPLWKEWAKQNPELMEELRIKSQGKILTDQFANTRVSQARALADILNESISSEYLSSNTEKTIVYTPKGKKQQTYTIKGTHIFNKKGEEVFKEDSIDRNKIFANLAVQEKRAVIVDYKNNKYVVNNKGQIISGKTGKIMQWDENNSDRKNIIKAAEDKFKTIYKKSIINNNKEIEKEQNSNIENIREEEGKNFIAKNNEGKHLGKLLDVKTTHSLDTSVTISKYQYENGYIIGVIAGEKIDELDYVWQEYDNTNKKVGIEKFNLGINSKNDLKYIEFKPNGIFLKSSGIDVIVDRFVPKKSDTKSLKEKSALEEARELVDRIIKDSETNVKKHENFDKEDVEGSHTYLIKKGNKWVPVDSSVTQLVHGKVNLGGWKLPSSKLGNTNDRFVRAYFEGHDVLNMDIPNLTEKDRINLKEDLDKVREYFNELFGKGNYGVVTKEFPIVGKYTVINKKGKPEVKTVAGTIDMLVYDSKGNFYIIDMKTTRGNFGEEKIIGYSNQQEMYKAILIANYPELKNKIKGTYLMRFDLFYPTPIEEATDLAQARDAVEYVEVEESSDKDALYIRDGESDYAIPITENELYMAPRLHIDPESSLYKTKKVKMKYEFEALTEMEKAAVSEEIEFEKSNEIEETEELEFEKIKTENHEEEIDETAESENENNEEDNDTSDNSQVNSLYNNPLLSASERMFLANNIMYTASYIITHLQTNPEANAYYFDTKYLNNDFTSMSREEIIDTVGIQEILNYIKETYYNPENRLDIDDFNILNKLQIAYDNWTALFRSAYYKLIKLEGSTVIETNTEEIQKDDIDNPDFEDMSSSILEENEREYYQLGVRHISAKASLSGDIRRMFERLTVVDSDNNEILDKYGYNFKTFVDSDEAINRIFYWTEGCLTIEEMEQVLEDRKKLFPWLNPILKKIKEEPLRSQFFQNFRKDFIQYSNITVEKEKNGVRKYDVNSINTREASSVLLSNITTLYNEGLIPNIIIPNKKRIDGKGKINIENIKELKTKNNEILDKLHRGFSSGNIKSVLTNYLDDINFILSSLGINVDTFILEDIFSSDFRRRQEANTNYFKILNEVEYILDTLLEQKNNTEYNPLEKDAEGNIYGNYKNIVKIMGNYMQDSIEASSYENGKMHYSFVPPSYLLKLIINLKNKIKDGNKFKNFIEQEFGSYKWFKTGDTWNNKMLELLYKSPEAREGLDHKVELSFNKTPYTELSPMSYALALMNEFFYDKNKKWAWYRVPILANKPSSEFIKFYRYSGRNYKDKIADNFIKVFNQEIMRIKTVMERAVNPDIQKIGIKDKVTFDIKDSQLYTTDKKGNKVLNNTLINKIKNHTLTLKDLVKNGEYIFSGTGAEFRFLPALNSNIVNGDDLGKLIVDKINGKKDIDETDLNRKLKDAIFEYMSIIVENEIDNYNEMGLFETISEKTKKGNITKYKYLQNFGNTYEDIVSSIEEYIWNDMLATINIIQLTVTDIAYYDSMEAFQKRYSQVHAPSLRLNVSATDEKGNYFIRPDDGKLRTIYLKDAIEKSDIIPVVKNIFDNKIKTLKGEEKKNLKIMRDLILLTFEKINVADAQGYSSITSYRKKLGAMGKWDPKMEEAYYRIRSGNLNVNDLGIIWQPLKPFVYTQLRKSSGAKTMSELKVPVQNKNSEYLLLLADAIIRSGNKVNKLTAIIDFMEDSAYDGRVSKDGKVIKEGTYNGIGIDTVQFESGVNSGSMGSIDLSKYKTYDEIKKALNDAVYYNSNKSEDSDNDFDRYNDQFVHAIPVEDYGIQQEVPNHFADHEQLEGSQIRILNISDITPKTKFVIDGKEITDEELKKEYQELHAINIRESFDMLVKDLKLKGSIKKKNKAISEILKEAIMKDQRYGSDLLRACSLNSKGEFIIPLNDPIQATRIQQLLNSIIKSRINKQKIKGGPVVQTSVFGVSDDLNIIWEDKEKGIPKYFECYMPIPSKELEMAMTKYDEKGHPYLMSIEEAVEKGIINEEMRKAIGYRIPTEDKYSMAPLYIKGFLPKAAGEAIMLPKEITTLSGSDFDIDKMYIMLKSFIVDSGIDYNKIEDTLRAYLEKKGWSKEQIRKYIKGDGVTESGVREYINRIMKGYVFSSTDSEGNYIEDKKGLQLYDWFTANKNKFMKVPTFTEEKSLDTRNGRNNRIFDLQWAVLTNEDTAIKMFNPGSFDAQKKSARIINILKSTNKYTYKQLSEMHPDELKKLDVSDSKKNILHPSTQIYFHKQNMTAGKLIGIFANNNTSHAFLSLQNIFLNIEDGFMFDGYYIDNENNNKLDPIYGKDGSYISKTIAGFLAASVDAVKDPVLNFMNLNTFTANVAMLLARLGFDSDSIGLFLTQPIIEKLTKEYFNKSNEGYVSLESVIKEFLPADKELVESMKRNLKNTKFTKEEMAEGLRDNDESFQISALLLFQKLYDIAQNVNTLTFITKFNSVTNAVGPTIADTMVMAERYNKFMDLMDSNNPPFNPEAKDILKNSPILDAFFSTTIGDGGASELIFKDYFIHYSEMFKMILLNYRRTNKTNIDSKVINKLANDFMLYKMTLGENPTIDGSLKNRKKFMLNFVKYYEDNIKDISNNALINVITINSKNNKKCPVATLGAKTGKYSIDVQERVKTGWSDLILNPETKKFGIDLFYYNIFRSGFGFSPKTFSNLASVDVKLNIPNYIDSISKLSYNNDLVDVLAFIKMFKRNHANEFKIVPVFETNESINVSQFKKKTENFIEFKFSEYGLYNMDPIIAGNEMGKTMWVNIIKYKDKLYEYVSDTSDSVIYKEVTPLGIPNYFLEYDGNQGNEMESIFKDDYQDLDPDDPDDGNDKPAADDDRAELKKVPRKVLNDALIEITKSPQLSVVQGKIVKEIKNNTLSYEKGQELLLENIVKMIFEKLNITEEEFSVEDAIKKVKDLIKDNC